jgi:hypothetical protein
MRQTITLPVVMLGVALFIVMLRFTIVVPLAYLEFKIVEKDLVTESADPRPLGLVVSRLEMTFETLKLREGLVAVVLSSTL